MAIARSRIKTDDFKAYGNSAIEQLEKLAVSQTDWKIVPNNYEGVRISCTSPAEDGWFLLRLSLHDPVIPLNIESNVAQGVSQIATRLLGFFQDWEFLDLSALRNYLERDV